MNFVRTVCQAQGAYDGVPERMGSELSESATLSHHCSPQTKEKELEEKKPMASEAAILKFSLDCGRWVADIIQGGFFTVTKNFGGRIGVIHCFYAPCKSGDIVTVQR